MERLLGHRTFLALVRWEGLCCFSAVYAWVQSGPQCETRVPDGVLDVFSVFSALLQLLYRDLRRPCSRGVYMGDASHESRGVVRAEVHAEDVRKAGQIN